ncbi:MAG: lytic transglycosylase domain-containing protein [Candidatus Kapaibacteriota bacterium]|jgi:membrane-bound lytic murein transglycosylase D
MKSLYEVRHALTVSCLIILMNVMLVSCKGKDNKEPISDRDLRANYLAFLSNVPFPETLTFCGEKVPLDIPEVRERAEREFYLNLQTPGQLILYIKRAGRFFPLFEQMFKEEHVPDDLKYLAVAESALFMARSPKDAIGVWQFMEPTARSMGLRVDEFIDERRHVGKSTKAAIQYLKSGYSASKSWSLAAAGYNMGHGSVKENIDFQKGETFYDLFLNEETSRYVLRIAIIKELMEHAKKYGLNISEEDIYKPSKVKTVKVDRPIVDLAEWAINNGTSYKDVKLLNPWILKRALPAPKGTPYYIDVPN